MDTVSKFLENPSGDRYDRLIHEINVAGAKKIFARLERSQQAALVTAGVEALGQSDYFYQWLWTTIICEEAKPIDIIARGEVNKILHILGRIQYGVYT